MDLFLLKGGMCQRTIKTSLERNQTYKYLSLHRRKKRAGKSTKSKYS